MQPQSIPSNTDETPCPTPSVNAIPDMRLSAIPICTTYLRSILSASIPVRTFIANDAMGCMSNTVFTLPSPIPEKAHKGSL